ncbi:DUF4132 domain-containing protein [Dyella mobilis]|uniref:DUF4132 domain-containing protein n=1 Tax=Dyella mobilis TaxID=1849582 RepID=A0ABS2KFR9_9GAMM|nr:DUF4132 domain-containing protein [Dyella mobilis]MBM7129944.1 DUF4132 domain-containing protein [Dyella mobilis]
MLSGSPESVLGELQKYKAVCAQIRVTGYLKSSTSIHPVALYPGFDDIPIDVLVRWTRVLAAAYSALNARQWTLALPGDVREPEALLTHASGVNHSVQSNQKGDIQHVTAVGVEKLLAALGLQPSALLLAAFSMPAQRLWMFDYRAKMVTDLIGYAEAVERHCEVLRPTLFLPLPPQRLHAIDMLGAASDAALIPFTSEIAELATAGNKQVRQAVDALLSRTDSKGLDALKRLAREAKPDQRATALQKIWQIATAGKDEPLETFAVQTASADNAASVRALVLEWNAANESASAGADQYQFETPTIDWSIPNKSQIEGLLDKLDVQVEQSVRHANQQLQERYDRESANAPVKWKPHFVAALEKGEFKKFRSYLMSDETKPVSPVELHRRLSHSHLVPALRTLAADSAFPTTLLLKSLAYFSLLNQHAGVLSGTAITMLSERYRATGHPTLLEISEMLNALGVDGADSLTSAYCNPWDSTVQKTWTQDAAWPFFAKNLATLLRFIDPLRTRHYMLDRKLAYKAVATLPEPPVALINTLYDIALGDAKLDRVLAQAALANLPNKEPRIISALSAGKAERRTVAAQWLGQLRHQPAIPALEKAVSVERLDIPKGAMLDALQMMGQPIEKYLNRDALLADATKSLAKGEPKELAWFPWNALPEITWADSGEPVPAPIVRWFLIQAVKQKVVEPNAILRKYCGMFAARQREALGQFVLETWLAEDIRPINADEAHKAASAQAANTFAQAQAYPALAQSYPQYQGTVEEITARLLPGFLQRPAGSAVDSKGLLAVVGACAGDRAAPAVARYLKQYYGTRASQGKALIATLSWIESPAAIQLMLSIGSRFRTKSFQVEAEKQAKALADRKGWTMDELADRTIPSAGFDESGSLSLSFGPRTFTARLKSDFSVDLFNDEEKPIKALPQPRQDDDAELAKDAKKAWANVKKELKNIVGMQTERLYEALCIGRTWLFDDWQRYVNQHPVMRHVTQRVVWSARREGQVVATFRPLEDGTLTDCRDESVALNPGDVVSIAHPSHLLDDDVKVWQQHLVDYEVPALFQQFGKATYVLPSDRADQKSIADFEGHLLETFALRGRAAKLGYTRGPTEDAGWFSTYEKRYPSLGIVAIIEFTGNPLPETNRTVALLKMSFASTEDAGWQRATIPLGDIPSVLLSESYNDMRAIAAEGPGFDPEWQKKSQY